MTKFKPQQLNFDRDINQNLQKKTYNSPHVQENQFKNIWVNASAGSGKTLSLTNRFIYLLLKGVPLNSIVCFTFTKSATKEMMDRIMAKIQFLCEASLSEFFQNDAAREVLLESHIKNKFGDEEHLKNYVANANTLKDHDDDLSAIANANMLYENMKKTCKDALNVFKIADSNGKLTSNSQIVSTSLNIQTFHSFCHELIKKFYKNYTIIDEDQSKNILQTAINNVYNELLEYCQKTILSQSKRDTFYQHNNVSIYDDLLTFSDIFDSEKDDIYFLRYFSMDKIHQEIYKNLLHINSILSIDLENFSQNLRTNHCEIKSFLKDFFDSDKSLILAKIQTIESKNFNVIYENYKKNTLDLYQNVFKLFAGYKNIYLTKLDTIRKNLINADEVIFSEIQSIEKLSNIIQKHEEQVEDFAMKIFIQKTLQQYIDQKSMNRLLDYNDIITKTFDITSNHEILSEILLSSSYKHFLIDEAQDINADQWSIVYKMIEELRYAHGNFTSFYVVGDDKQSIYSFHGADGDLFVKYKKKFKLLTEETKGIFQEIYLNKCFRCGKDIVKLVNKIFPSIFQNYTQHISAQSFNGSINIYPIIENTDSHSMYKLTAITIVQKIKEIYSDGQGKLSDMMILIRNRNVFLKELITELQKNNINFCGVNNQILLENVSIKSILAFGDFALNSSNNTALALVLVNLFLIPFDVIHYMRHLSTKLNLSLWKTLLFLKNNLDEYNNTYTEYSIKNYEKILLNSIFFIENTLKHQLSIKFFYRLVIIFEDLMQPHVKDKFLSILDANFAQNLDFITLTRNIKRKCESVYQENEEISYDAVRVFTVHKAKGLQSKIVFLPDTTTEPRDSTDEYYRLLYVAITRAESDLHIYGWGKSKGWYEIINNAWNDDTR